MKLNSCDINSLGETSLPIFTAYFSLKLSLNLSWSRVSSRERFSIKKEREN